MAQPPPDPNALPESVVLSQWAGLRNTVTAERLAPGEMAIARNIDIDDAGQVHRRRGYTRLASGQFHSLYRSARGLYAVRDGDLVAIRPDYSTPVLRSGVGADPLGWAEVGPVIFFSSATASGKILGDESVAPWGAEVSPGTWISPVVNPSATLNPVRGRLLGAPPLATAICHYNGRVWLAQGTTLWATELYLYDLVDKTRGFLQFESDITVLGGVADGFYVGTRTAIYFLSGPLTEMRRAIVRSTGALPGSLITAPSSEVTTPRGDSRNCVLFLTPEGLLVGQDSGICLNLTDKRMVFPEAQSVAAMFRRQDGVSQYVAVANSGGTPSSAARIGDYVDAEIRRFQGA